MNSSEKTKNLVLLSLFAAITAVLAFTPIGFIQLAFVKATIVHVPVIIGSILLGPKAGAVLGGIFGLTSLINNTVAPAALSFCFSPLIPVPGAERGSLYALLICFLPRILVGVAPWYVYRLIQKLTREKGKTLALAAAGVAGSLTNTLLVMHTIFFLFRDAYASVKGIPVGTVYGAVLSVIFANGVPEAIVAGVITCGVCRAILGIFSRKPASAAA